MISLGFLMRKIMSPARHCLAEAIFVHRMIGFIEFNFINIVKYNNSKLIMILYEAT